MATVSNRHLTTGVVQNPDFGHGHSGKSATRDNEIAYYWHLPVPENQIFYRSSMKSYGILGPENGRTKNISILLVLGTKQLIAQNWSLKVVILALSLVYLLSSIIWNGTEEVQVKLG